ncbi:hypothetical protein HYU17_05590 [Candidatus Woesearchaeota archaeon]|nr:hypothetical protein [Candidatus Woesearchaeota archaeon]
MARKGIFGEALGELKTSIAKLFLFEELLNAILVFLVAYLISSLFGLGLLLPSLLGLGYLAFAVFRELHLRPEKSVETKYKDLKERLTTASEYASVDNRVVNELKSEVLQGLRKVEESSFLDERKVYIKSIVAIVLCFAILLLSPVSMGFLKASFPDIFSGSGEDGQSPGAKFKVGKEKAKGDLPIAVQSSKKDIYGQPTIAKLGSEELKVVLKPAGTELGTSNVKPPEELQFDEQYPEEVVSVAAESMEERIPKEQQELVRRYFKSVVEASR